MPGGHDEEWGLSVCVQRGNPSAVKKGVKYSGSGLETTGCRLRLANYELVTHASVNIVLPVLLTGKWQL